MFVYHPQYLVKLWRTIIWGILNYKLRIVWGKYYWYLIFWVQGFSQSTCSASDRCHRKNCPAPHTHWVQCGILCCRLGFRMSIILWYKYNFTILKDKRKLHIIEMVVLIYFNAIQQILAWCLKLQEIEHLCYCSELANIFSLWPSMFKKPHCITCATEY